MKMILNGGGGGGGVGDVCENGDVYYLSFY